MTERCITHFSKFVIWLKESIASSFLEISSDIELAGLHHGRFPRAQRKPKPPMPGSQLIVKPNKESVNYRPAIERTNKVSKTSQATFQGIAMQQSNGMKQQQLQHGMHHRQRSRGRPHGSHAQQRLHGNIVKMPSTFGVLLFIE